VLNVKAQKCSPLAASGASVTNTAICGSATAMIGGPKMTILRTAKVTCPKCGHPFTVRQQTETQMGMVSPENADRIRAALDEGFAAMDKCISTMDAAFKKVFDRKLWR